MDLISYLTFEENSIKLKNPLKNIKIDFELPLCFDFLINYQKQIKVNNINVYSKAAHWWKRKWQVSLDYYLFTASEQKKKKQTVSSVFYSNRKIDIDFPKKIINEETSPVRAVLERKTFRKFQDKPLRLQSLSTILGELKEELLKGIWNYYIVIFNVEKIPPGIYCYSPNDHGLSLIKHGLFRNESVRILCGMSASHTASFLVVLTINVEEAQKRYPYNRALREIYIDSGRLAQKILLKGMQNSVGGLPSPAMKDSEMCEFLNLNLAEYIPIYTITMGLISDNTSNSLVVL